MDRPGDKDVERILRTVQSAVSLQPQEVAMARSLISYYLGVGYFSSGLDDNATPRQFEISRAATAAIRGAYLAPGAEHSRIRFDTARLLAGEIRQTTKQRLGRPKHGAGRPKRRR